LQTVEEFADRVLTEILHATVDPDKAAANPHWKFLAQLSEELKGDGTPLQLSLGNFDQAVIEAATAVPDSQPLLSFLLPCWQRAQNERSHPPRDGNPEKIHVLTEAKRLCVANCFFALAMPELFGRETPDDLAFHLLKSPTDPLGIDHEFIDEAIRRFSDIESLADIFTEAMVSISQRLSSMNMEVSSYRQCIDALTLYTRFPVLLGNLTKHPSFNMDTTAREIEDQTFLGPFFKLSPLKKEVLGIYFPTPRVMDQGSVARAQDATRQVVAGLHNDLYHIANSFVRVGKEARGHLLDWFAQIVNKNHKRRALQVDPTKVASDGFMMNVNAILDRICLPVTDNKNFEKVGNIDINYFRQKPRVDISDETKLNADQARSDAFYETKAAGEPGFVSEIFFLTLASHHYGLEAVTTKLKALERDIRAYQRHVAQMEDQRTRIRPTASEAQLQVVDRAVTKHVQALERAMRLKFGLEGLINDRKTQGSSLSFLRYVSVWLIRVASQTKYNPSPLKTKEKEGETAEVTLPFPASTEAFACLPEYAVQNVVDSVKFCYRFVFHFLSLFRLMFCRTFANR
jgi:ubiquitin conjugation factor E4 B